MSEKKVTKESKKKVVKKKLVNEEIKEPKKTTKKTTKVKEETKVLLTEKDQKPLKLLSKVISIIAKVLRVCSMVIVPFMCITAIIIPILCSKVEINGNIIKFDDARFVLKDDYIAVNISDKVYLLGENIESMNKIVDFLNSTSITKIVVSTELVLVFTIAIIVINIYLLEHVGNLFENFATNKTPFTLENCDHIHKIGRFMIITLIVSLVFELILVFFCENISTLHFATYGIISIILVYILYYIFTYATNMQKMVDTKIYN